MYIFICMYNTLIKITVLFPISHDCDFFLVFKNNFIGYVFKMLCLREKKT